MFSKKLEDAFNEQINAELYSSYLYLSMASWLESQNFTGMSSWMRMQADEEHQHAMKFYDFILERGARVTLKAIDTPKTEWETPLDVVSETYEHEQKVTSLINGLVDLANGEGDHASQTFLQWFVTEQVEEEATASYFRDKLAFAAGNPVALLMIDQEMGGRSPESPAAEGN